MWPYLVKDGPDTQRTTGFSGSASAPGPDVFCTGGRQVIGMQFVELDNPDGGIVRARFLCGGVRTIVRVDDYVLTGNVATGNVATGNIYGDPSGQALTNGRYGSSVSGENVGWVDVETSAAEVGRVKFSFLAPSRITGVSVHSYTADDAAFADLRRPSRLEFVINDQKFPLTFDDQLDDISGVASSFLSLASVDNQNLLTESVTMIVYGQGRSCGGVVCRVPTVVVSEVQFSSLDEP